jgi:hypothetical protein
MNKTFIVVLITFLAFPGCRAIQTNKEKTMTAEAAKPSIIDERTNIHYTGQFCDECHDKTPAQDGDSYLKFNGDYSKLCRCHHGMSPGYCHPIDVTAEGAKKLNIPADFPVEDGKFTCNTCHDVYKQCQKRLFDRQSLRGAPYPHRTDFCFRCHDKQDYKKLNAHHQIQADGTLNVKMCLYCHAKKPNEKTFTYKDVTFVGDIKALCRRCHQIAGNHSGNFDHIGVTPSAEALKRMETMKEKYQIILPLTKDGKMTCITCHNPHQKGVIAEDKPSAKGADSEHRHRLPGKLCLACHEK